MTAADVLAPVTARIDPKIEGGRPVGLRFWDGSELPGPLDAPTIVVKSPRAIARVIHERSELGFGRAWVAGELDVDGDVAEVLTQASRVRATKLDRGDLFAAARAARRLGALPLREPEPPASEARLRGRLHSLRRDKQAIQHHYDVSNRFYRLVLGPTMVYSCAYFQAEDESLDTAQTRKLDLVCRELNLQANERLLDVGCGSGSLVIASATHSAARPVAVAISEASADRARARVRVRGLEAAIESRRGDYRGCGGGRNPKMARVAIVSGGGTPQLGA